MCCGGLCTLELVLLTGNVLGGKVLGTAVELLFLRGRWVDRCRPRDFVDLSNMLLTSTKLGRLGVAFCAWKTR